MKTLTSFIISLLAYFTAVARENPAPYFICLYNGRIMLPFLPAKPENKQHVKTVLLSDLYTHTEDGVTRIDTTVRYRRWYTPNGEEITLENTPYSEFQGFRNISFNKDGTLASKTFETHGIRGCSNYHWNVGGIMKYNYEYRNGRCTQITTGDSNYISTVNTYNNKGLKTRSSLYYYTLDSGKTRQNLDLSYQYRYDKKGLLTEEYQIDQFRYEKADSINSLPGNMLHILLRQTPEFKNKYLVTEFGITEDSLYVDLADLPKDFVKRIDDRDSVDDDVITGYKEMTRYFTGYVYDKNGSLSERYMFDGDDLQQVETFTYDDKNRLIKWDCLNDFDSWNNWSKGKRTVWTFVYNKNNQPVRCERKEYIREYQSGFSEMKEKPPLKLDETEAYEFSYNADGSVTEMKTFSQNSYANSSETYLVKYEHF